MAALVPGKACSVFISKKKLSLLKRNIFDPVKVLPSDVVLKSDGASVFLTPTLQLLEGPFCRMLYRLSYTAAANLDFLMRIRLPIRGSTGPGYSLLNFD